MIRREFLLEGEAVAAETEKSGVTIPRRLCLGEKLLQRMRATVFVLVRRHRNAGARGFAYIQRCAVAAEDFHG